MTLEASIMESLEQLRNWQIDRQTQLFKHQQEQREKLSIEQKQMCKALGLSVEDITVDQSLIGKMSMLQFPFSADEDTDLTGTISHINDNTQSKVNFDNEQKIITEKESKLIFPVSNNTEEFDVHLNTPYVQIELSNKLDYNNREQPIEGTPKKYQESLTVFANEIQQLSQIKAQMEYIDDIPVPSPKKDFNTLLEEKLKDSEAIETNNNKLKNKIKRTFLKKGDGLARFGMHLKINNNNNNNNKTKNSTFQGASLSSKLKVNNNYQKNNSAHCASKRKDNTETRSINKVSRKSSVISKFPPQNLNLRNVQLPMKELQRRSLSTVANSLENDKISITSNKKNEIDELDQLDMDTSRLETKMFELLEEKAENSSFCSTSSAVLAFMQQSTPIKLKNIRKNLQFQQKIVEVDTTINDNEALNQTLLSKIASTSVGDSRNFMNESKTLKDVSTLKDIQKSLTVANSHNTSDQKNKNSSSKNDQQYQYYLNNIDTIYDISSSTEVEFVSDKSGNFGDTKIDCPQAYQKADADVSVHVRFSEYNEYKSLTDASTVSRDSYNYENKMWGDHSVSTESSDTDISIDKPGIIDQEDSSDANISNQSRKTCNSIKSNKNFDNIFDNQSTDEYSMSNDSTDNFGSQNIISEFQESIEQVLMQDDSEIIVGCNKEIKTLDTEMCKSQHQSPILDDVDETILKSELLKNRLLELEREIDIFRKENFALTSQRQKFHDDHNRLQKEFKEKHKNLKKEKIKMENILQEEKKRLAREKAALENRLRDAREKSLQTKQERLEIQSLKEKLKKLQEDIIEKENRWHAAQARQRSQIRVLQMENLKLKEEIDKLEALKKGNTKVKKPVTISNTKAIHEINKQLGNQRNNMNAIYAEQEKQETKKEGKKSKLSMKSHAEIIELTCSNHQTVKNIPTEEIIIYDSAQVMINEENNQENTLKKRCLYESLLKDTTNGYGNYCDNPEQQRTVNENIENTSRSPLVHKSGKETKIQINAGLKNNKFDMDKSCHINSEQDSDNIHHNEKLVQNEQSNNRNLGMVQKSYKQFVQEVIDTKNEKFILDSNEDIDLLNSADVGFDYSQRPLSSHKISSQVNRVQTILSSESEKNSTGRSNQALIEPNSQKQPQSINYGNNVTNSQICSSKLNYLIDSDLSPRREHQKPLPRPTQNIVPNSECNQINQISESHIDNKCALHTVQQNTREVKHSDGHIEYWYSNGNVKRVYPERNISKMIYYNGDVCETTADGCIKYFYAATKTWQTTYLDGFEILEFPDGQQERRTTDGVVEVSFPDGSVRLIQPDGIEKWVLSDGIIAEIFPNCDKILSFPDGQREIHTSDHKRREYPDGTVKFIYLDGTQETRYSNGRIRIKDKDGNLIMDSH